MPMENLMRAEKVNGCCLTGVSFCFYLCFMQALFFYAALPFIYLVSLLPFRLLYCLSDIVFVILYYVVGYRKKVVHENLTKSFPKKSSTEIILLQKEFYRHLCDLFLESFKSLTIRKEAMLQRCTIEEDSLQRLQNYYHQKQSIILVLGHLGNWEWAGNTFSLLCKQPLYVIYHPLHNRYYNQFILAIRTRFGTRLIEMKNTFRDMLAHKEMITATAFIADQTPPPDHAYWTTFLNQDTPIFWGTEKIAKKLNYPVIYVGIKKIKRGYYTISAQTLCENPATTTLGEISECHTRTLELAILQQPSTWLWSHRRWKHKRKTKA
jgi:Kdo2-lipid IVA lauroyltransferase/acyltransferase